MLARIQSREPYYDHKKWDAERKQDVKYLANIQSREVEGISRKFKFEATLPPLPHSPRSESNRSRAGSRTNTIRFNASSPKSVSPPATPAPVAESPRAETPAPVAEA